MRELISFYHEIKTHLLQDTRPSEYFNKIYDNPIFSRHPFAMLYKLRKTKQSPEHHPEGNVWNHTMLVIDEAAKVKNQSKNSEVFMWAALLHDIGKPATTKIKRGRITSYRHDEEGAKLAREFFSFFTEDNTFIKQVCNLIRYHMQILFVVNNMHFADIEGMKRCVDVHEIALLGLCDRLGRGNNIPQKEHLNIKQFLHACGATILYCFLI